VKRHADVSRETSAANTALNVALVGMFLVLLVVGVLCAVQFGHFSL